MLLDAHRRLLLSRSKEYHKGVDGQSALSAQTRALEGLVVQMDLSTVPLARQSEEDSACQSLGGELEALLEALNAFHNKWHARKVNLLIGSIIVRCTKPVCAKGAARGVALSWPAVRAWPPPSPPPSPRPRACTAAGT